jgi:hypothetical protein
MVTEITDVILPPCECAACSSEQHRNNPGPCQNKANATGTEFCTSCKIARAADAKMAAQSQANDVEKAS